MAKTTHDDKRRVLGQLVIRPSMKKAAAAGGVSYVTLFRWIRESIADPEANTLTWLGHKQPFHLHCNAARKLNVVAIDHNARDLAINGHSTPKFFNGAPVWKIDPVIASDALTMDDMQWIEKYGSRPFGDTYARDPETGGLIQDCDVSPPNPQLLVKLLTSLAPEVYGERSQIEVTHAGHVWIEGGGQQTPALMPPPDNMSTTFGLTARPEETQRPTNTLAIPRPCATSGEFDARFRKKLLREPVLFYDCEGKLLPPFADDVIVAGTSQARAFEDAGIEVKLVHPTTLLDEGYENTWLRDLAPNYKRKPVKEAAPVSVVPEDEGSQAVERVPRPGKASGRYDSENLGFVKPPSGGKSILR